MIKYLLVSLFLLMSDTLISQVDTLYLRNNEMVINDETYKKYITDTTLRYLDEQLRFMNGVKIREFRYTDTSLVVSIDISWYPDGTKKRIILFNRTTFSMLDESWDKKGSLIETEYRFDNTTATNTFYYQNGRRKKVVLLKNIKVPFENIIYYDSINQVKWIEKNINQWYPWLPTTITECYETGQVKATGHVILKKFDLYDLTDNEIAKNKPCKNGQWIYFNKNGTIKEVVIYKNCIRQ